MTTKIPKVGFLGPVGTFTEEALLSQDDLREAELIPMRTFVDVLNSTQDGSLDFGFVAIENAIEGTVNVTLDTLAFDTDLRIQREIVLDIKMNLMALPGTTMSDITTIASHPIANAQCRQYLHKHLPNAEILPVTSTAEGARVASTARGTAALGPASAGELYELDFIDTDVADLKGNQTRFLLVGPDGVPARTGNDKTTVVLAQHENKPGSLVAILHEFSARNLDLTKLTSRPTRQSGDSHTSLGRYTFIIDIDGHIDDDVLANCLINVQAKHADVKFLGSYPAAGNGSAAKRVAASDAWTDAKSWMANLRSDINPS